MLLRSSDIDGKLVMEPAERWLLVGSWRVIRLRDHTAAPRGES